MNVMFLTTERGEICNEEKIEEATEYLLDLNSEHYETLYSQLSEKQRNVFLAIAAEKRARGISSGKFIHKYRLPSASSVVSAVRGLLDKDLITQEKDEYFIYDYFFQLWIQRNILPREIRTESN